MRRHVKSIAIKLNWQMFCWAQRHQPAILRVPARLLFRYVTRPLKDRIVFGLAGSSRCLHIGDQSI